MTTRREVISKGIKGLGMAAAGLSMFQFARRVEAGKPAPPPPACNIECVKTISGLPPNALINIENSEGNFIEALSNGSGVVSLKLAPLYLLRGVWAVQKPGQYVYSLPSGTFPPLRDVFIVPAEIIQLWGYRCPMDYPGTILKGLNNYPMILTLDSNPFAQIPQMQIDLVELDVTPTSEQDLMAIQPPVAVKQVIHTWVIEPGSGYRTFEVPPITIPAFSRTLAILRRTPTTQTLHIGLDSTAPGNELEIVPAS